MKRRFFDVSVLYLAQALPLYFCTFALPTILRSEGISLTRIGLLMHVVLLPWVIKFLWAPFIDKHYIARLGKRRSWFIPLQCLSASLLIGIAKVSPEDHWWLLFFLAILLSTISATQDIAVDGYAVEQLPKEQHRWGNLARVTGTTLGSMLGGALLIASYEYLGWTSIALMVAGLCSFLILPILNIKETPIANIKISAPPSLRNFWERKTTRHLLIMCLVYRACEGLVMGMQQPFLVDIGLDLSKIGIVMGIGNATLGLVGATLASYFFKPLGPCKALALLGFTRTACYLSLALIAFNPEVLPSTVFTVVLINMASRLMEMVVLYTIFMNHCSEHQAGTDFTVLVCSELFIYSLGMFASGYLATLLGYNILFLLGASLSLPGTIAAVYYLNKLNHNKEPTLLDSHSTTGKHA